MYFAFIITFWGKGIMYLFMGFFIFSKSSTFAIVVAVIFWCLFVLCVISFFFAKGSSAPLLQKGEPPSFDLSSADFYGGESGGKKESKKSKSGVEDNKDSDYYKEDPEN
ncbi:COPI associated protein [Histomonas meleagridis]|uniref:COPI associated protein n=1 Tax=Histomonas meleagridis TaxID=135588 RepID=UPI00355AA089|nr:COPI associated protein [Histomonas meleagridis]KAH0802397.1 COPI associated protein [Histomonas meleagridis]